MKLIVAVATGGSKPLAITLNIAPPDAGEWMPEKEVFPKESIQKDVLQNIFLIDSSQKDILPNLLKPASKKSLNLLQAGH